MINLFQVIELLHKPVSPLYHTVVLVIKLIQLPDHLLYVTLDNAYLHFVESIHALGYAKGSSPLHPCLFTEASS